LRGSIACQHRSNTRLTALHKRLQRKNAIAVTVYAASVPMAWISIHVSLGLILLPAFMYFLPDREIEKLQKE